MLLPMFLVTAQESDGKILVAEDTVYFSHSSWKNHYGMYLKSLFKHDSVHIAGQFYMYLTGGVI